MENTCLTAQVGNVLVTFPGAETLSVVVPARCSRLGGWGAWAGGGGVGGFRRFLGGRGGGGARGVQARLQQRSRGPAGLRAECGALPQALTLPLLEEMQQTFKYFQTKQDTLKGPPVTASSASGRI